VSGPSAGQPFQTNGIRAALAAERCQFSRNLGVQESSKDIPRTLPQQNSYFSCMYILLDRLFPPKCFRWAIPQFILFLTSPFLVLIDFRFYFLLLIRILKIKYMLFLCNNNVLAKWIVIGPSAGQLFRTNEIRAALAAAEGGQFSRNLGVQQSSKTSLILFP